jgi:hypothetical protein
VNIFDETVLLVGHMGSRYECASLVFVVVKTSGASSCVLYSPRCVKKYLNDFLSLENIVLLHYMNVPIDIFIKYLIIWIMLKQG